MTIPNDQTSDLGHKAKAWPFEEARKLVARTNSKIPKKGYVLFETGYGPSGLPHIGTFGEVARTSMVRHAFESLCPHIPTKLFCFSDDMDGFRKIPANVPKQEMLAQHLGKPLTQVPDPYGKYESYAHHNNAMLNKFLDDFGFQYEFLSSTKVYHSGRFDAALLRMLEVYEQIQAIMLPTLGAERQKTYSPFLPISPKTGKILQVAIEEIKLDAGSIVFRDEDGQRTELPVTGGNVKLQWKPDWGMRWYALGVDYEMAGKDLIDSVKLGAKITKNLGGRAPDGFNYELFLDEKGEKISKSKGNGLSIEEWLTYAPRESLSLFMYQKPRTAKRLYFDIIPKTVDDYLNHLDSYANQKPEQQIENPVWHIHQGAAVKRDSGLSFSLLLNLAAVVNSTDPNLLWGFISKYDPSATPQSAPYLDKQVSYAIRYYHDFVLPNKNYRSPTPQERAAMEELAQTLMTTAPKSDGDTIQSIIFSIGKKHAFLNLRDWFKALYQVLFGQDQGPRFGSFVALYGPRETAQLIQEKLTTSQNANDNKSP